MREVRSIDGLGVMWSAKEANPFAWLKRNTLKSLQRVGKEMLEELFNVIGARGVNFCCVVAANGDNSAIQLETEFDVLAHVGAVLRLLVLDAKAEVPKPIVAEHHWYIEPERFGLVGAIEVLIEDNEDHLLTRVPKKVGVPTRDSECHPLAFFEVIEMAMGTGYSDLNELFVSSHGANLPERCDAQRSKIGRAHV